MNILRKDIKFDGDMITFSTKKFELCDQQNKEITFQAEVDDLENAFQQIGQFINAVNELFKKNENLKENILNSVFEYYKNIIYPKKNEYNKAFNINLENINDITDIKSLISLNEVFVFIGDSHNQGVGFSFSSEWDPEHGLGVRMVDWEICKIGGADRAFLPV